jgi:threonine synthase
LVVSVPSGNLGNLTAGLLAKKIGLPIDRFIAAHNANDTFNQYLSTGAFVGKPSVLTYSNAMDVGNPSNFERIEYLYQQDLARLKEDVSSNRFSDESTIAEMKRCYQENNYILDPHGAVGILALNENLKDNEIGVFLETAHPQKFSEIIVKAIPDYASKKVNLEGCRKISMKNQYGDLRDLLTRRN